MSLKTSISNTLRRLNLNIFGVDLLVFGQALFDGLAEEFDRVNDFKDVVKSATVANENMAKETLDDYEQKYGIVNVSGTSFESRRGRVIERASENGNGGPDWIQQQIRQAGFDLYVHVNEPTVSTSPQFGDFQFNEVQFGDLVTYTDPRDVSGELIASSPVGNIGGLFEQFGDHQFSDVQFGTLISGSAYPRPSTFSIPSDPNRWAYVFFLSPFDDRLATSLELLALSRDELRFLNKLILQIKFTRNWCIAQVTTATLQDEITEDGLVKTTEDGLLNTVVSDL